MQVAVSSEWSSLQTSDQKLNPMTGFMLSRFLHAEYCIILEVHAVVASFMSFAACWSAIVSTFDAVYFVLLNTPYRN
jgi:hypothetical protein